MNLQMCQSLTEDYRSGAQKARVATESWAAGELYCPACLSKSLDKTPTNFKVVDFVCPACDDPFQLKGMKSKITNKIPDGAYDSMISAIREDRTPNLILLNYRQTDWQVTNLMVIPRFAFSEQAIIPRKALAPTARRSGWIGCVIDLSLVAPSARISMVHQEIVIDNQTVARQYQRLRPLASLEAKSRGWTLAVLNVIQSSGWKEFKTQDTYGLENRLAKLFPNNRHIRQKTRQQLQVLRDLGFLIHESRGCWKLKTPS